MKLLTLVLITALTFLGVTRAATDSAPGPEIYLVARFIEFNGEPNKPASADAALEKAIANLVTNAPPSGPIKALLDDPNHQLLLRQLSATKRVDLMSVPSITTRSGQRATIEVAREWLDPSGKPVQGPKVGVTLDVLPTLTKEGSFDLNILSKIVEFEGFIDGPNKEKSPSSTNAKPKPKPSSNPARPPSSTSTPEQTRKR